jgi:hypothetical protein
MAVFIPKTQPNRVHFTIEGKIDGKPVTKRYCFYTDNAFGRMLIRDFQLKTTSDPSNESETQVA